MTLETPPSLSYFFLAIPGLFLFFAGTAKLFSRKIFKESLISFSIPASLRESVSWIVPFAEVAAGLFLLVGLRLQESAVIGLSLLGTFTCLLLVAFVRSRDVECRCFGDLVSGEGGVVGILRNLFLAGFLVLALLGSTGDAVLTLKDRSLVILAGLQVMLSYFLIASVLGLRDRRGLYSGTDELIAVRKQDQEAT